MRAHRVGTVGNLEGYTGARWEYTLTGGPF